MPGSPAKSTTPSSQYASARRPYSPRTIAEAEREPSVLSAAITESVQGENQADIDSWVYELKGASANARLTQMVLCLVVFGPLALTRFDGGFAEEVRTFRFAYYDVPEFQCLAGLVLLFFAYAALSRNDVFLGAYYCCAPKNTNVHATAKEGHRIEHLLQTGRIFLDAAFGASILAATIASAARCGTTVRVVNTSLLTSNATVTTPPLELMLRSAGATTCSDNSPVVVALVASFGLAFSACFTLAVELSRWTAYQEWYHRRWQEELLSGPTGEGVNRLMLLLIPVEKQHCRQLKAAGTLVMRPYPTLPNNETLWRGSRQNRQRITTAPETQRRIAIM